jgi:hypothetical protein
MLVGPGLLTYFPCAQQPELADGLAGIPNYIVAATWFSSFPVGYVSSPFMGLSDLYMSDPLSIRDSSNVPSGVAVYRLDEQIPGSAIARAVGSTSGT